MVPLASLWLPILLSAVLVFIASSVIHMASPWHKNDYPGVPDEDGVRTALRPFAIPPGDYMVPRPGTREEMKTGVFQEKVKQGPNVMMTVMGTEYNMGKTLAFWFLYLIAVGLFAGYVAGRALGPGTDYLTVFRFTGTVAFAAFSLALWQMSIWYWRKWSTTFKSTFDGLIYAMLTAGVFGWLWPK